MFVWIITGKPILYINYRQTYQLYIIIPVGRNCIGRFGYGPKLTWAEIVMGRNVQWPVSYSEIHFFRFLNREFYDESRNINMLVGSWSFWVSNVQRRWVPPWSVTNFLLTLLLRYMYIIKSNRLTRVIKYCKRTLQCTCCNQFSFLFFYLLFLSSFLFYFFFKFRTRYFLLSFNYAIVSKLSQLKKKHFTLTYFMCCLKNIFLAINAPNLIKGYHWKGNWKTQ